mgnify:CR=1 FL=1
MNALLKSGQPELIYSKALEYYQKEKWQRASTLFEGVQHYYTGSSREDSISFFNARCKFKNRDYDTASTLLDDFHALCNKVKIRHFVEGGVSPDEYCRQTREALEAATRK